MNNVKRRAIVDFLDKHGDYRPSALPNLLALEVGINVSESYAGRVRQDWKLLRGHRDISRRQKKDPATMTQAEAEAEYERLIDRPLSNQSAMRLEAVQDRLRLLRHPAV